MAPKRAYTGLLRQPSASSGVSSLSRHASVLSSKASSVKSAVTEGVRKGARGFARPFKKVRRLLSPSSCPVTRMDASPTQSPAQSPAPSEDEVVDLVAPTSDDESVDSPEKQLGTSFLFCSSSHPHSHCRSTQTYLALLYLYIFQVRRQDSVPQRPPLSLLYLCRPKMQIICWGHSSLPRLEGPSINSKPQNPCTAVLWPGGGRKCGEGKQREGPGFIDLCDVCSPRTAASYPLSSCA